MQYEQKSNSCKKTRKTDRRTLYTRKMILDSYIKLLKEKPRDKIMITEICRIAEINRCTFYLHFSDIKDVESAIVQKILRDVKEFVQSQENLSNNRLELSYKFMNKMLHDDTYMTLMSIRKNDSLNFSIIQDFYQDFVNMSLPPDNNLSEREKKLLYNFVVGGIVATHQYWIESGIDQLKEENLLLDQLVRSVMSFKDK
jgi:Transcriptional regulator